jgi:hypothetical protein
MTHSNYTTCLDNIKLELKPKNALKALQFKIILRDEFFFPYEHLDEGAWWIDYLATSNDPKDIFLKMQNATEITRYNNFCKQWDKDHQNI